VDPQAVEVEGAAPPDRVGDRLVDHARRLKAEIGEVGGEPAGLDERIPGAAGVAADAERIAAVEPAGARVALVPRVVLVEVVGDEIEEHSEAAGVGAIDEVMERRLAADPRLDAAALEDPVAVVALVEVAVAAALPRRRRP